MQPLNAPPRDLAFLYQPVLSDTHGTSFVTFMLLITVFPVYVDMLITVGKVA